MKDFISYAKRKMKQLRLIPLIGILAYYALRRNNDQFCSGMDPKNLPEAIAAISSSDSHMNFVDFLNEELRRQIKAAESCYLKSRQNQGGLTDYSNEIRRELTRELERFPPLKGDTLSSSILCKEKNHTVSAVHLEQKSGLPLSGLFFRNKQDHDKPCMLFLTGHYPERGVLEPSYYQFCSTLADNGFNVFSLEAIGQGSRRFASHDRIGLSSIACGLPSIRGFLIRDAQRALDYLVETECQKDKVVVAGHSGGGLQTRILSICDDRPSLAVIANAIDSPDDKLPEWNGDSCMLRREGMGIFPGGYEVLGMQPEETYIVFSDRDECTTPATVFRFNPIFEDFSFLTNRKIRSILSRGEVDGLHYLTEQKRHMIYEKICSWAGLPPIQKEKHWVIPGKAEEQLFIPPEKLLKYYRGILESVSPPNNIPDLAAKDISLELIISETTANYGTITLESRLYRFTRGLLTKAMDIKTKKHPKNSLAVLLLSDRLGIIGRQYDPSDLLEFADVSYFSLPGLGELRPERKVIDAHPERFFAFMGISLGQSIFTLREECLRQYLITKREEGYNQIYLIGDKGISSIHSLIYSRLSEVDGSFSTFRFHPLDVEEILSMEWDERMESLFSPFSSFTLSGLYERLPCKRTYVATDLHLRIKPPNTVYVDWRKPLMYSVEQIMRDSGPKY